MKIQRKHLDLIAAIQSRPNMASAAQQLHLTPSALSHQLNTLEKQLGSPVFHRKSKPLELTASGQRLWDASHDVLPRLERLDQDLERLIHGREGRLNIAIECHSCYQWLLPTLDQYRQQWPQVELDISGGFSFDGLKGLQQEALDLVITADPQLLQGIHYIPLFRYEALLIMHKQHPLTQEPVVTAPMLRNEILIIYPVPQSKLDIFRLFLQPENIEPADIRYCELTIMMIGLVTSGRGVCTLPNWAANEYTDRHYVAAKRLGADGVFNTLYAAVREESMDMDYIQDFLFLAKDLPFSTLEGIAKPAT